MNTETDTRSFPQASSNHEGLLNSTRYDIYSTIHKALRLCMMEALADIGSMDTESAEELHLPLSNVEAMLGLMRSHLAKENKFVHPALEARQPGTTKRIADEHLEHEQAIDALSDEIADLWASNAAQRAELAQRLYRHLALFIAENLEHMYYEETAHNTALWIAYTDAELQAIEAQIKSSLSPQEMMSWLRWIARSATPQQIIGMMTDMQANVPLERFEPALELVRQQLSANRWTALSQALNLPQVPAWINSTRVDWKAP
jgi:hypothetical protein